MSDFETTKRIVDEIAHLRDSVDRIFGHLIELEKRVNALEDTQKSKQEYHAGEGVSEPDVKR